MLSAFVLPSGLRRLPPAEHDPTAVCVQPTTFHQRCPVCNRLSRRVHSQYWRTLHDLPQNGQSVCLRVRVRRFFCDNARCSRRLFAERLPELARPYAQRTERLRQAQTAVVQAVGSRPGVRLAQHLALGTSATTLLRLERKAPLPVRSTPRVLGIDDWAFRRGHRYGTLLYDHERHCIVDLLPDRESQTVAQWLLAHPGVEIVTRDRAECYADAVRQGAPEAVQVADRWHLVKNLAQALERFLDDKRTLLRQAAQQSAVASVAPTSGAVDTATAEEAVSTIPTRVLYAERLKQCHRQERLDRYEAVRQLWREGLSQSAIHRRLHLDRKTIRKFLCADLFPERKERTPAKQRPRRLAAYEAYLRRRWEEGCHNVAQLLSEIRAQGYPGCYTTLKDWVKPLRRSADTMPPSAPRVTPSQVVLWLLRREDERSLRQTAVLEQLARLCEPFRIAAELSQRFLNMVRQTPRSPQKQNLAAWLTEALTGDVGPLRGYAASLQRDEAAVEAGLSLHGSNGPVEGSVNRLKCVKRRGYGRANFDLLRRRVLNPI